MPESGHGRANIHYDRLPVPSLGEAPPISFSPPADDDLLELEREAALLVAHARRQLSIASW